MIVTDKIYHQDSFLFIKTKNVISFVAHLLHLFYDVQIRNVYQIL